MTHELKIMPPYYDWVFSGLKTFEIRKDDRGYKVGDELLLKEWLPEDRYRLFALESLSAKKFTGREHLVKVTCIVKGFGLKEGYVVLGIKTA